MKTKFIVSLWAHDIELIITKLSHPKAADKVSKYCFDTLSMNEIENQLVDDQDSGEFTCQTHIVLCDPEPETLVEINGTWRIIPNYSLWNRVMMWEYNRNQNEVLTEEMFKDAYKYNGSHYFSKWKHYFNYDIAGMINYFRSDPENGKYFMSMVMEKVTQSENRIKLYRNEKGI